MARILLAHATEEEQSLHRALAGHDVDYAISMEEAIHLLETRTFSLVICALQFDDSRMFELLRYCKSQSQLRDVPFCCVRLMDSTYCNSVIVEGLQVATKALGAAAFLDLVTDERIAEELVVSFLGSHLGVSSG